MTFRQLGRRFWLFYFAGWIPYVGLFSSVFFLSGELPVFSALAAGLTNGIPASLFGVGVVWVCCRVPLRTGAIGRFLSIHAGTATLYAALVAVATGALFFATWSLLFEPHMEEQSGGGAAMIVWQFFMGMMLYMILASLMYAVLAGARLREEQRRATEAEALRAKAELQALRAQLNPHFLFNTLHSLLALVRNEPQAAEDAIEQFADLLRYASRVHDETRDEVTLSDEWQFVQNYLALESLRIGERLAVHADIDKAALECVVPAFCLQPLVENAIRHGIAPRASGGTMWIRGSITDGKLQLEVKDDGPGADYAAVFNSGRLGLRLVRQRLEALYGNRARFEVVTLPAHGFTVRVSVPTQRHDSAAED